MLLTEYLTCLLYIFDLYLLYCHADVAGDPFTILVPHHLEARLGHGPVGCEHHREGRACGAVGWRGRVSTVCTNERSPLVRSVIELGKGKRHEWRVS